MASSTKKSRVKVQVQTTIWVEGEKQEVELTVFGSHYKKETAHYLQYEEIHDEQRMNTVLKLTDDEIMILRNGVFKMRMYFREGERLRGMYETPYGKLPIFTKTKQFNHTIVNNGQNGKLDLYYDLYMDESLSGTYNLQLTYEEATDEHR